MAVFLRCPKSNQIYFSTTFNITFMCTLLQFKIYKSIMIYLLQYSDLFPTPGSTLTGHTDAVEHEIYTGDSSPIRCAPRRMSP